MHPPTNTGPMNALEEHRRRLGLMKGIAALILIIAFLLSTFLF